MARDGRLRAGSFTAQRIAARSGRRILLDLPGDRVQPPVDVGDLAGLLAGHRRALIVGPGPSFGGAESPTVELSQSLSDMPARRAAASALSRTDGSMPSLLHDTREFMLSSGSDRRAICAFSLPRVPRQETIEIRAGRLPLILTFSRYGK